MEDVKEVFLIVEGEYDHQRIIGCVESSAEAMRLCEQYNSLKGEITHEWCVKSIPKLDAKCLSADLTFEYKVSFVKKNDLWKVAKIIVDEVWYCNETPSFYIGDKCAQITICLHELNPTKAKGKALHVLCKKQLAAKGSLGT